MRDDAVVIDLSAWIAFFRPGGGPASSVVDELIRADRAVLVGPVLSELLQGARADRERRELRERLGALPYAEIVQADWQAAGETLWQLRRSGVTVPLTDALIAVVAIRSKMAVLTIDSHFRQLGAQLLEVRSE